MKLINRDTDYAIRALLYLKGTARESISADRLVTEMLMPRAFARRLLQVLSREGILRSRPGKGGGYAFRKKPANITLRELVEVFQPGFSETKCIFKKIVYFSLPTLNYVLNLDWPRTKRRNPYR